MIEDFVDEKEIILASIYDKFKQMDEIAVISIISIHGYVKNIFWAQMDPKTQGEMVKNLHALLVNMDKIVMLCP